jgi:antitoxin VapB
MRTVSIFQNRNNQALRIPADMRYEGVTELEVNKVGNTLILRPHRPSWNSFGNVERADDDFLSERPDVVVPGRVNFDHEDV